MTTPLTLHAEISGDGPALLLLHGLFGSSANWRRIARELAATHQVHALDLRNHGASPWSDAMAYEAMAGDVAAYLERAGLQRASVLGHSMGGKTAMALALTQPEKVERLIVADIAPVTYGDTLSPVARAMLGVDFAAAASRMDVQRQLQALLPEPAVAPFLAQNVITRDDRMDWRVNVGAIVASMADLAGFPKTLSNRRYEHGPVHVIAGALSPYVSPDDGAEFQPMFPGAEVSFIDGAGHWVHADQPEAFVAAARRALAQPI